MAERVKVSVQFSRNFKRQYKKAPKVIRDKFHSRLGVLMKNPDNPALRLHRLKGKYGEYYSINITGDWRALFRRINNCAYFFVVIGTHSQVY